MLELRGYARHLMADKLNILEGELEELEKLKISVAPGAIREEGLQHEIEAFLQWCESTSGHYEESTYEEKRRALRHLDIKVRIYRYSDPNHPHYVITARPEFFERLKRRELCKISIQTRKR